MACYADLVAAVDVLVVAGHAGRIRRRSRHGLDELIPICACGWKGPGYPANDKGSAVQALKTHRATTTDLTTSRSVLCLSTGSGRAAPAARLRNASIQGSADAAWLVAWFEDWSAGSKV